MGGSPENTAPRLIEKSRQQLTATPLDHLGLAEAWCDIVLLIAGSDCARTPTSLAGLNGQRMANRNSWRAEVRQTLWALAACVRSVVTGDFGSCHPVEKRERGGNDRERCTEPTEDSCPVGDPGNPKGNADL